MTKRKTKKKVASISTGLLSKAKKAIGPAATAAVTAGLATLAVKLVSRALKGKNKSAVLDAVASAVTSKAIRSSSK